MKKIALWASVMEFVALVVFFVVLALVGPDVAVEKAIACASIFAFAVAGMVLVCGIFPGDTGLSNVIPPALVATATAAATAFAFAYVEVFAIAAAIIFAVASAGLSTVFKLSFWRTFAIYMVEGLSMGLAMTLFKYIGWHSAGIGLGGLALITVLLRLYKWYEKYRVVVLLLDPRPQDYN